MFLVSTHNLVALTQMSFLSFKLLSPFGIFQFGAYAALRDVAMVL